MLLYINLISDAYNTYSLMKNQAVTHYCLYSTTNNEKIIFAANLYLTYITKQSIRSTGSYPSNILYMLHFTTLVWRKLKQGFTE